MTIYRKGTRAYYRANRKYGKKSTRARKVKLSKKARVRNAFSSLFRWRRGT